MNKMVGAHHLKEKKKVVHGDIPTNARRGITRQSLQKMRPADSRAVTRDPSARLGPEKVSVARLPVTGSDVFGREEDIAFLDHGQTSR
jgi:hypothetical protein